MVAGAHCSCLPRGTFVGIKGSCFLGHYSPEAGETNGKERVARAGLGFGGARRMRVALGGHDAAGSNLRRLESGGLGSEGPDLLRLIGESG